MVGGASKVDAPLQGRAGLVWCDGVGEVAGVRGRDGARGIGNGRGIEAALDDDALAWGEKAKMSSMWVAEVRGLVDVEAVRVFALLPTVISRTATSRSPSFALNGSISSLRVSVHLNACGRMLPLQRYRPPIFRLTSLI